jgi:hypothetical protein
MMRAIGTISAGILALSCVSANSQTLTGHGAQTCEKWTELHRSSQVADTTALDNWVFGYLDGEAKVVDASNRIKGLPPVDILQGLDSPTIVGLVGEYCRGNPLRTVDEAVSELTAQMVAENRQGRVHASNGSPKIKIETNRPRAETTGSGDITGSITPIHQCEIIAVNDPTNTVIRKFRKCD